MSLNVTSNIGVIGYKYSNELVDGWVAVAKYGYFAYSTDGINWTEGTISGTSRGWISVCYGNGKYVAVGYNIDNGYNLISGNDFAYSTDGMNWTEGTISSTSRRWQSVCYGNGKFVAVADISKYFAYSTDGIHWIEGTISSTNRYWESVCYGNGIFIAVASNYYYAYSIDGINWVSGKISSGDRAWQSVCYGNGIFIAVGTVYYKAICTLSYYQFSGWSQIGNITITDNTVISGKWIKKDYLPTS